MVSFSPIQYLRNLLTQPVQLLAYELSGINQLTCTIDHPLLDPITSRRGPGSPLLQISILVHGSSTDHEHQRLREPLPSLSKARSRARSSTTSRTRQASRCRRRTMTT